MEDQDLESQLIAPTDQEVLTLIEALGYEQLLIRSSDEVAPDHFNEISE
jgi:hypothetical protein